MRNRLSYAHYGYSFEFLYGSVYLVVDSSFLLVRNVSPERDFDLGIVRTLCMGIRIRTSDDSACRSDTIDLLNRCRKILGYLKRVIERAARFGGNSDGIARFVKRGESFLADSEIHESRYRQ